MRVFIGTPTHNGLIDMGTHTALLMAAMSGIPQMQDVELNSLITRAFNRLWCKALNAREKYGVTHFLLIHADVAPRQQDWLKIMLTEMETTRADVLSAVVPIKNRDGFTSTALDTTVHQSWREYMLTMTEVMGLPETFDADVAYAAVLPEWRRQRVLLPNTGLLLVDFRKPWVEGFYFTVRDEVAKVNGGWEAQAESEDWNMGRRLSGLGCKVLATRKVKLDHVGRNDFPNYVPWGLRDRDEGKTA